MCELFITAVANYYCCWLLLLLTVFDLNNIVVMFHTESSNGSLSDSHYSTTLSKKKEELLTLDELKDFIKLANNNILMEHIYLVSELKQLYKTAKNWKTKFDHCGEL